MAADERRLSPLDAAFLYVERPHQRLHVGCVALLDGPIGFDDFATTLAARLAPLPRYQQRPVRPLLDLDWPRWQDDAGFDLRRHVRHVAVPAPGGERELHDLVDTLFALPFDRRHPLWEAYLIDGLAGGRAALLWKTHHSMIDGVSGAQVLAVIADPVRGRNGAGPARAIGPAAGSAARGGGLRAALQALAPSAVLSVARDAVEAAGTLAALVLQPPSVLPFNGPLTDARRIVWTSFSLDEFIGIRGEAGCKVNDVVLAVITGALRRYLVARGVRPEGLRVRTLVPVSVRGADDHLTLGNLVSGMFPLLPVGVAEPGERLRRITAEMRSLKERGQARVAGLAMQAAGRLPAPLSALLARFFTAQAALNTVCTNVPGPREELSLLGRRILEVHPIVPLFEGMGLEFAIMSYAGHLSICAAAEPHLVPDAADIPGHLQAALGELREAFAAEPTRPVAAAPAALRVADLMTTEVVTIGADEMLGRAHALMRLRRIRHLPVVSEDGRLIGLVTHRDLLAAESSSLEIPVEAQRLRVLDWARARDVMETHLSVSIPAEPAAEAGARMIRHKIGCLPVLAPDGRLAGILTEEDFLRWATSCMARAG